MAEVVVVAEVAAAVARAGEGADKQMSHRRQPWPQCVLHWLWTGPSRQRPVDGPVRPGRDRRADRLIRAETGQKDRRSWDVASVADGTCIRFIIIMMKLTHEFPGLCSIYYIVIRIYILI